jgi:hypothetical protein
MQQQQLKRCDSDRLLQSMSLSPPTLLDLQQQQQQQQEATSSRQQRQHQRQQQQPQRRGAVSSAAAAAALAVPELQLLALELLLEELDIQYVQDVPLTQQQQQQQQQNSSSSSPELHLRLQASLLQIQFRHSNHGSTAELSLNDLVLQDVLPAPAAAAAAAALDMKRLLSHMLLDRVQVAWRSQLRLSGAQQELQAALIGLQVHVRAVFSSWLSIGYLLWLQKRQQQDLQAALTRLQLQSTSSYVV